MVLDLKLVGITRLNQCLVTAIVLKDVKKKYDIAKIPWCSPILQDMLMYTELILHGGIKRLLLTWGIIIHRWILVS